MSSLLEEWEKQFVQYFNTRIETDSDAAHDLYHFARVSKMAKKIASIEKELADPLVLLAASYFHDLVNLPKDHKERDKASHYSAIKASELLLKMGFPQEKIQAVSYAILTHSYSLGITPTTIEAKIIQDADRMEALGALGIMRCFYICGKLKIKAFDPIDPEAKNRPLNDLEFALDHFYVKLFKLPSLLQTEGGRILGSKRAEFLQFFVEELKKDMTNGSSGPLCLTAAMQKAGNKGLSLFSPVDPFAKKRLLNPEQFALDSFIACRQDFPAFFSSFQKQLEEEIL